ncbi:hypothetical protein IQ07DRAFT_650539 [Pyrenochaeta sp. DS3sAY3a]|nr:hypothetical protein IQ07DRAFT_650539 [Pyrenochaeta sp. DS3sAY3a]
MRVDPVSPTPDSCHVPGSPTAARRAKKRATDRKSQRTHRERRRAYVQNLEEKVAVLTAASSTDERVAALLAENEALRKRCHDLVVQLSRIRTLACEAVTGEQPDEESRPEMEHENQRQSTAAATAAVVSEAEDETSIMGHAVTDPALFQFDPLDDNFDFSDDFALQSSKEYHDERSAALQSPSSMPVETNDHEGLLDPLAAGEGVVTGYLVSSEIVALDTITAEKASLIDVAYPLSASPPIPNYCRPQGYADRLIHAMLEEARGEHEAGKFDTSNPSLAHLLAQGPRDILSFRLFHYIKQYGPIPMHWMLATFWVQYLFLRWNVLKTPESYALVPYFLRPTPLEHTVPHRLSVNMLVWPDIRQALIRDALTVSPEDVGAELLKNLSPYWPPSFGICGDLIASMDVYRMIEVQAVRYDFWKVGAGFLDKYSQYRNCDLGLDF